MSEKRSSRIPGFYKRSLAERAAIVTQWAGLSSEEQTVFLGLTGLSPQAADHMIENVIGIYGLPLGVATNFTVNDKDYLVPMVVEEPSVVAGLSFAARLIRDGGGFSAGADDPIMIGQMQVLDVEDFELARDAVLAAKEEILAEANTLDPVLIKLGGGARDLEVRVLEDSPVGPMMVIHLLVDVRDAMGANTVNTACEHLTPKIESLTGGRVLLRILSNLADKRLAWAEGRIPADSLATPEMPEGKNVARAIVEAYAFAAADPYRAATHNKGIMNGMDALAIATGNDWRALEAGAHTYAARGGRYTALSTWKQDENGDLIGRLELPVGLGTFGGTTRAHPVSRVCHKILGCETARELAMVAACVGLAQNLAAIRALATEGIQKGHMRLHARQFAISAGASGAEIDKVVARMVEQGTIRLDRAEAILKEMRENG